MGSPTKWDLIFKANQKLLGGSPNHLKTGMTLTIPAATGPAATPARTHTHTTVPPVTA